LIHLVSYRISIGRKYSNTTQYPGNGNRYPPCHEHGYQAGIERCRFAPPLGRDLEIALDFQKTYYEAVWSALEARFVDNDIIDCFKILIPLHMRRRQVP